MQTRFEKVLMKRDGLTAAEAAEERRVAVSMIQEYVEAGDFGMAYEVCYEWGLEPDYLDELIF